MQRIPSFSPELLTAEDYRVSTASSNLSATASFRARAAYFQKCAENVQKQLTNPLLDMEERDIYSDILQLFQLDDSSLEEFAYTYICMVVESVLLEHLDASGVALDDREEFSAAFCETMITEQYEISENFLQLLEACNGFEYTSTVFIIANNVIDLINMTHAVRPTLN